MVMVGKDKRCTLESQQKWSNIPFPATARAAVDEETIRPTKFCYLGNHSITLLSPGLNAWTSAATGIGQYNTIQKNTKFVKRHVAVASEASEATNKQCQCNVLTFNSCWQCSEFPSLDTAV